jgi:ABC-type branched-subunit amino acid transport system substrate-binding protein
MISMKTTKAYIAMVMSVLFLLASVTSLHAQADMIGTSQVIAQQQLTVDRATLTNLLTEQAAQEKLASMGVSVEQVEQRIASLTAEELASFNAQLSEAPAAGADAIGILVFFLLLFVITDMLCATNIYNFVNCVNR